MTTQQLEHSLYIGQEFYRFTDKHYYENQCEVRKEVYQVVALTAKGAWIEGGYAGGERRLVFPHHRRSFAYSTIEAAWASFQARKAWQVKHLRRQLKRAKLAREASRSVAPPQREIVYLNPVTHELHQNQTLF